MDWKTAIPRVLLGLIFLVSGINKLIPFTPEPEMPAAAMNFIDALSATPYFIPVLALAEIIAGGLLVMNRFVPLALLILAPVMVQILMFHLFLAPLGLVVAIVVVAIELFLAWAYRDAFRTVLQARHTPATAARPER